MQPSDSKTLRCFSRTAITRRSTGRPPRFFDHATRTRLKSRASDWRKIAPGSASDGGERDFKRVRVAWSKNLGGLPVDRRVIAVLEKQRKVFESLGCIVEDAEPDLRGADEVFQVMRANSFAMRYGGLLEKHRDQIKDTVIWNIEAGLKLDGPRIGRAFALRSDIYRRMREFMERYEFLCLPVNQVP